MEVTRCFKYEKCGHVFEKDSADEVRNELREFRKLRRELSKTTDPQRMKEIKEYEIPAKENAIRQAKRKIVRRQEVEE